MAKSKDEAVDTAAARRQAVLAGKDAGAISTSGSAAGMRVTTPGGRPAPGAAPAPAAIDTNAIAAAIGAAIVNMNQQQAARAGTPHMDRTVPGGCYIVDGVCVNAHNEVIEHPDHAAEALEAWYEQQAQAQAPSAAAAEAATARAEEEAEEKPTAAERRVQADNEARSRAAAELRKRTDAAAKELAKQRESEAKANDKDKEKEKDTEKEKES